MESPRINPLRERQTPENTKLLYDQIFNLVKQLEGRVEQLEKENKVLSDKIKGNIAMQGGTTDFGGGDRVTYLRNGTTVPSSNPTDGGYFYVNGGAWKYRGSSGTITTIAAA